MKALLATQTDERLVALTRAGNERAFEVIVQRYQGPLTRYANRLLPASRAEDAVQHAFINAYEALGRSDDAIELKPWLYRITHNASLNLLRQNGWDYDQIPPDFDGVMRPDQAFDLGQRLRDTVAAVQRLPDRQREAIVLRELEGRSYEEIAAALGTGDGAVRQLLNRARTGLRTAAAAITPWPLVLRLATSPTGAGAERAVEVAGAAGLVKVGAATLATVAVVGGAAVGPVDLPVIGGRDDARRPATALAAPASARQTGSSSPTTISTAGEQGPNAIQGGDARGGPRRRATSGSGDRDGRSDSGSRSDDARERRDDDAGGRSHSVDEPREDGGRESADSRRRPEPDDEPADDDSGRIRPDSGSEGDPPKPDETPDDPFGELPTSSGKLDHDLPREDPVPTSSAED